MKETGKHDSEIIGKQMGEAVKKSLPVWILALERVIGRLKKNHTSKV